MNEAVVRRCNASSYFMCLTCECSCSPTYWSLCHKGKTNIALKTCEYCGLHDTEELFTTEKGLTYCKLECDKNKEHKSNSIKLFAYKYPTSVPNINIYTNQLDYSWIQKIIYKLAPMCESCGQLETQMCL